MNEEWVVRFRSQRKSAKRRSLAYNPTEKPYCRVFTVTRSPTFLQLFYSKSIILNHENTNINKKSYVLNNIENIIRLRLYIN
jgi:hypothetical protein